MPRSIALAPKNQNSLMKGAGPAGIRFVQSEKNSKLRVDGLPYGMGHARAPPPARGEKSESSSEAFFEAGLVL